MFIVLRKETELKLGGFAVSEPSLSIACCAGPGPHHPIELFHCYGRILSESLTFPVDSGHGPLRPLTLSGLCAVSATETRTPLHVGAKCGRPQRGSNRTPTTEIWRFYPIGHGGDLVYRRWLLVNRPSPSCLQWGRVCFLSHRSTMPSKGWYISLEALF